MAKSSAIFCRDATFNQGVHMKFLVLVVLFVSVVCFANAGQQKPLQFALWQTYNASASGKVPVFVFDLDETLVYSHARRYMSYRDALSMPDLLGKFPAEMKLAMNLKYEMILNQNNTYSAAELFNNLGIFNVEFIAEIEKRMLSFYLTDKHMMFDTEIPGASAFIKQLRNAGAYIYFVSSRYNNTQFYGTYYSLLNMGFINYGEGGYEVLLRPWGMNSIDFKKMAFSSIAQKNNINGKEAVVMFVFENEPENINAMVETFPSALPVFIDGAFIKNLPVTAKALRIKNYLE